MSLAYPRFIAAHKGGSETHQAHIGNRAGFHCNIVAAAEDLPKGFLDPARGYEVGENRVGSRRLSAQAPRANQNMLSGQMASQQQALAHKHREDRYGMVVSGVHYIGYGDKFDEKKSMLIRQEPFSPSLPIRRTSA
jgi:hypothetical protein